MTFGIIFETGRHENSHIFCPLYESAKILMQPMTYCVEIRPPNFSKVGLRFRHIPRH